MIKEININELSKIISKRNLVQRVALFIWGVLIYAISFTLFFEKYDIVTGGTTGLSILIKEFINIKSSILVLVLSLVILIVALYALGIKESIKTLFGVILLPIFMEFAKLFLTFENIEFSSLFLVVFCGGLLMGVGNGLIMKSGFSTGGFQTIYQILYKYFRISMYTASLWINGILIVGSGFFFGFSKVLYALIGLYISSLVCNKIMLETSASKTFFIVTDKYKEVKQYITDNLGHSVTEMNARGGYTNDKKKVLMCAVPTREFYMTKKVIEKIDKESYILITDTYEIRGGM